MRRPPSRAMRISCAFTIGCTLSRCIACTRRYVLLLRLQSTYCYYGGTRRYVEHPIPIEPPAEPAQPPPQPMPLTKRERKKLRTQRRLAAEKEKQDQIRCGLMAPPPPKVKISNLMQAPSAISRFLQLLARRCSAALVCGFLFHSFPSMNGLEAAFRLLQSGASADTVVLRRP